ncbi:heavy metal translocating P-type ATPase [Azospirillum agricola]|uniref:heavy metal translocating P-type ATPase n=1 Tax=Azospirillum agricola TaxID=1720247 RepID=UPI000A0F26D6|nr:heavy metal translocating P-type ATPase [Azospirillum agricola]SMH46113.1 ATPase, P-type (transporting), HAD superfamily, subfamily IC/heavy metal translocating P-type ATPase [Azospirillum lipoferum]
MAGALTRSLALLAMAAGGLILGALGWWKGENALTLWAWSAGTIPVLLALTIHILQSMLRREAGLDILAVLAMAGALVLGEHLASIVIALMVASGQALEAYAGNRAQREMTALLGRAPRTACRYVGERIETVTLDGIKPGDRLLIRTGDVLPVDGTVAAGPVVLDESALTGEPLPIRHAAGETVRSGTTNAGDPFDLIAVTTADESTYAGVVRLVEAARASKAPSARLADRYALLFVSLTLAVAGLVWLLTGEAYRALAMIVVATPCPLILAVPVAIASGMSRCARRGVLVKGAGALEALATVRTLLFDKTGTLTGGRARVIAVETGDGYASSDVLRLAASLDQASQHVLAEAIIAAARARGLPLASPSEVVEHPGFGIAGLVDGHRVVLGSFDYVSRHGSQPPWSTRLLRRMGHEGVAGVFVGLGGAMAGAILLADEIRPEAPRSLRLLRKAGVRRTVMVTGDRRDVAEAIGAALGLDGVVAECTPSDKVKAVAREHSRGPTMMVGDGVNDAPALAAADIGVSMGARGAAASSETADVVLLVDRLDRLAEAMRIARRSRRIALQSVLAGMGMSFAAMGAAAFGFLPPLAGAMLQEAIDVVVILNALRALGPIRLHGARATLSETEAQRLKAEHDKLVPLLDRIRFAGDQLAGGSPPPSEELVRLGALLRDRLLRHEQEDDATLYPQVAKLLGGEDPMAAMSREHREIGQLVRVYSRMVADLGSGPPDDLVLRDVQRVLYSLDAILRLHFAQEEEIYQALTDAA